MIIDKKYMYLGKVVDLWSRFEHGYLKKDSKVHKNARGDIGS
ncbi:hypothetical protein bcgnr5379_49370 [Bacillus cereus]